MRSYFKWECRAFFTNHKNIAIYLLLLFFSLFYWLQIERNYSIIETVSKNNIQASVDTKEDFLANVNLVGETHPSTLESVELFKPLVKNEKEQLKALEKEDYKELAKLRSDWYFLGASYNPLYFKNGNLYASEEAYYARFGTSVKLLNYAESSKEVTLADLNEKTTVDALFRALNYLLPMIFMILGLVFSMDVIAKDRQHKSLLKGMPLSDGKKIITKFMVVSLGVLVSVIPLSVGFIGIGIENGFGDLNMPVSVSYYPNNLPLMTELTFETIPFSHYLLQAIVLISLLIALLICISLLLGMWVKNAYFLLLLTLGLPFIDVFYNRFGYGDINPVTYLPTTYVRVGDILTGHRSFFFSDVNLDFQSGLVTIGVFLIAMMIFLGLHSRFKKLI